MNREIEYRGKCVSDSKYAGEWVTGGYVPLSEDITPNDEGLIMRFLGGNTTITYHVDPDTVGQFTGLVDKNDKRVFEGDILRVKEYKNLCWDLSKSREERDEMMRTFALDDLKGELDKEYMSAVAFEEGTYCLSSNGDYNDMYLSCLFGDMNGSLPIFDFEIIGNVYDNPDLLSSK